MIGELEYNTFFVDNTLYLPHLTRFVFASFCVLIPIVFMNLLVSCLPSHIFWFIFKYGTCLVFSHVGNEAENQFLEWI